MSDAELLTKWRSWVHPNAIPEGWDKNLWEEFYGLQGRSYMWNGYKTVLDASPEDAQQSARYLTRWVLRNHIETQAIAIRRIADRSTHQGTVALGRLLDEIAAAPQVLGVEASKATEDAETLASVSSNVRTFANKVVAHLDTDHAAASRDVNMDDFDKAVDVTLPIWQRWFTAITGEGVAELRDDLGWSSALRLHRRDLRIENPGYIGAVVVRQLGEGAARELLDVLKRTPEDRAALIGRLYGQPEGRWLAKALMDIEEDLDDLVRLGLIAELERMFGG